MAVAALIYENLEFWHVNIEYVLDIVSSCCEPADVYQWVAIVLINAFIDVDISENKQTC